MIRQLKSKRGMIESPVLLVFWLGLSVLVAEFLIMLFLHYADFPIPPMVEIFVDSITLVILTFPVLYFLVFKRLTTQIDRLKKVQFELQNSIEADEAMFDGLPFGVDIIDGDRNIIFVNKFFQGKAGGDIVGKKCWEVYRDDKTPCENCPLKTGIRLGERKVVEIGRVFNDRFYRATHVGIMYRGHNVVLEVFDDITERKEMDKMKDDFVSSISHELRTPLSIIKEGISLVLDQIPGKINERQSRILSTTKGNIDRLTRIINSLLDISKIEAGKLRLIKNEVDFNDLAKSVVDDFKPSILNKGLKLEVEISDMIVKVNADSDKIIQVITNLLGNALKFTNKGVIKVKVLDKGDEVECSIADTGIGIGKESIPKVFDKFQQFGRVVGAGEKGTGLGLAIAKGIVEAHDGRIKMESVKGMGSEFTFSLPKGG